VHSIVTVTMNSVVKLKKYGHLKLSAKVGVFMEMTAMMTMIVILKLCAGTSMILMLQYLRRNA
jgi:hypothetical protein